MKKIYIILCVILFSILLTSCSSIAEIIFYDDNLVAGKYVMTYKATNGETASGELNVVKISRKEYEKSNGENVVKYPKGNIKKNKFKYFRITGYIIKLGEEEKTVIEFKNAEIEARHRIVNIYYYFVMENFRMSPHNDSIKIDYFNSLDSYEFKKEV